MDQPLEADQLRSQLASTAFAFRGYNVTNLGRSHELLRRPRYRPFVEQALVEASEVGRRVTGREMDLVSRVQSQQDTGLESYADAIGMIMAMELAQVRILEELFEIKMAYGKVAYGFSLGEITALVSAGVLPFADALEIPLAMAPYCVELSSDVTLGVLFSRGRELPMPTVQMACLRVNQQQQGVVGVSAILAPNSYLVMGQEDSLDRFRKELSTQVDERVFLRKNDNVWPPLHTPIVWQRFIPNRAAMLMQSMRGGLTSPSPPILSMVTGQASYNDINTRELLHQWVDHPQKLWDAVYATLAMNIKVVVHVGPGPNIIPATFRRLQENVETQLAASLGLRAAAEVVRRPWLKTLVPAKTALLRAPLVKQVILEDWLLDMERHL